jgi:hydrophobe/amphiphile efflux-1 (HAE1) family protein
MSLAERCIHRPIAVLLLSIGVFLAGAAAYAYLPVAPLPHVDFPTIGVSAKLPGADPVTMAETVAAPLERRIGQIAGVNELTSTSGVGSASITAQFDLNRDIEGAAHDIQAAINASGSDLPADLPSPPTYRKLNPADTPILILAVTSDTLSTTALYDACDSILVPAISQIYGVAQVTLSGADQPAVRVQVDPQALASTGLDLEDVRTAIANSNVNEPKGSFEGPMEHIVLDANDQINGANNYAPIVLGVGANKSGTSLRLSDVAKVKNSVLNDQQAGWYNTGKAVLIIIQKQANANVIDTVDSIKKIFPQLERWMPAGTKLSVLADRTQTIRASVGDVEKTLLISIALVILVVYFALGRITPTLATIVTVPLSLAGTFGTMWLLGYSLDNISLMAVTVSVGFVVDDAIVMIENITRYVEEGMQPMDAAVRGAKEITFTVISISISLVAVFIPLLFMGGIIGRLFREFAVTLTVAILVSMIVSLTVTPTFYGQLMTMRQRRGANTAPQQNKGEKVFEWLEDHYGRGLNWVMRHQRVMLGVMFITIVLTVALYIFVPKGFFPQQDTGLLMGTTQARTDISFAALEQKHLEAVKIVLADPAVAGMGSFVGAGGAISTGNEGRMFVSLKPLGQRDVSADQVIARLRPKLAHIEGIQTFLQAAQDIQIGGRSTRAQYQFVLWTESWDDLNKWAPKFLNKLRGEPGIADLSSDQDAAGQQVNITVDRDIASRLGIDMTTVDQILQDAFAQRQVSIIYTPRNEYHVVLEVGKNYQQNAMGLDHIFIKSATGQEVRLSTIAHIDYGTAPVSVRHQGQFPAATLSFNLPPGTSLGDAAVQIQNVSNDINLPANIHAEFAGSAKVFSDSLKDEPLLILAALFSIYIVLGVLYESVLHPITIISTLPSAGVGALVALWITGNDLSLISIIGVILLMGIVKKNGIMLVDFALMAERDGASPQDAVMDACRKRFRPIMMTTMAAVLGALPLALSLGNGGELRRPLGVAIVGGLLISQMLTLFTTPVVYLFMERRAKEWDNLPTKEKIKRIIRLLIGLILLICAFMARNKGVPA